MSTLIASFLAAVGTTILVLFGIEVAKALAEGILTVGTSMVAMTDTSEMIAGLKRKNNRNPLINGVISTVAATAVGVFTAWWVAFIVAGVLTLVLAFLLFQLAERRLTAH